jgi:predicted HicB family RNase H-like nuclease
MTPRLSGTLNVRMPEDLREKVRQLAYYRKASQNQTVCLLLEIGLEKLLPELDRVGERDD